jgi:GNAT superfamily N-acetyltransferase
VIELVMVLEDLARLPRFPLPPGYSYRGFGEGDGELWARIETSVGTATAWHGTLLPGGMAGRLNGVGICREYQGTGIGKPLVSRAMDLLSARHDRVYLTTHRSSLVAVKIYLGFGFVAYITDEVQDKEWGITSQRLGFSGNGIRYRY